MQSALPSTAMNAAAIQRLVPELFRITAELEAASRHYSLTEKLIKLQRNYEGNRLRYG